MADQATPESLLQAINKLVEAQTFSTQAVEGIARLREENSALKHKVDGLTSQRDLLLKDANAKDRTIETLEGKIKSLEKTITAFTDREAKVIENEKETAVAKGKVDIVREMMNLVFRNTQVREHLHGNVPYTGSSANPNTYPPTTVPVDRRRDTTEE